MTAITGSHATVLEIVRLGNPSLTSFPNEEIKDPSSQEIRELADNMTATLLNEERGVGLAAPQIGKNLRIVVYTIPEGLSENQKDPEFPNGLPITIMINPSYAPMGQEKEEGWERCLSLPDFFGKVPRYKIIRVTYQDLEGNVITRIASLFHARVIQHELDHIEPKGGIIYPQRIPTIEWGKNFGYREEINKFVIESEREA